MPAYCFSSGFSSSQRWRCARDFIFERITSSLFCRQYRSLLARQSANSRRFWRVGAILIRFVPLLLFAVALSVPILLDKKIFFEVSPNQACGLIYPDNPFLESVRIGTYVREHTEPGDTIAVLGSEPEIYFYSHRHSATGYIYTYGLMEPQKYAQQMQQEMIREIEGARPKYLISVAMGYSWLRRPDSEDAIFTWANEYMAQNYTAAGFVNIKPTETDYFFGDVPQSVETLKNYILIYRRNL